MKTRPTKPRARWHVGHRVDTGTLEAFTSTESPPTSKTYGNYYTHTIGPFHTRRAAKYYEAHGLDNPACSTVAQAERQAASDCQSINLINGNMDDAASALEQARNAENNKDRLHALETAENDAHNAARNLRAFMRHEARRKK